MAKLLNILFVSSEVDPFAKTGGLADVSGALPQTIKGMEHEIRVIMPRYGSINERKSRLHQMIRLNDIVIPVGSKTYPAAVKSSFITNNQIKVQVYFIDNPDLFGRTGLYVHPETKKDYHDNDERFIFFDKAVLELLKRLGWQPDIIHCNDWQTGLIPAYLKTVYKDDPFYADTRTVFTIHNMAYQGIFPKSSFAKTGLPPALLSEDGIEAFGNVNLLKSGLMFADAITTVSEKYAEEIRTSEEYGCGLQDIVKRRKNDVSGIVNGIDYSVWDPSVDTLIPHRYDVRSLDQKIEDKKALLRDMGLPFDEKIPVVGIISRLADQKGFDLIGEVLDEIMKMGIQLVVLGTGEKKYHELFEKAHKKYPTKVGLSLTFNNTLAHLIEAGSDMFLMPSRYEPCGLNQLYSLRYGTVPVVRATGGLDDTIDDFNASSGEGTGFKFKKYDSHELIHALQRAVHTFADAAVWRKLMRNGMAKDFSWEISARKYVQLYRNLVKK
ncbi:MAG: glycogen synthase GlgA [Bacteroidota bacterium]